MLFQHSNGFLISKGSPVVICALIRLDHCLILQDMLYSICSTISWCDYLQLVCNEGVSIDRRFFRCSCADPVVLLMKKKRMTEPQIVLHQYARKCNVHLVILYLPRQTVFYYHALVAKSLSLLVLSKCYQTPQK